MDTVQAVLIDTVSIQRYIFSSNKLKENIGASSLVQEIYETFLAQALQEVFPEVKIDLDAWKISQQEEFQGDLPFSVGYIGGGNALLLFRGAQAETNAENFIHSWTRILLVETPGIIPAIACGRIDLADFKASKQALFRQLDQKKASSIPQTILPQHGITAQCTRSGFSREAYQNSDPELRDISSVSRAKLLVVPKKSSEDRIFRKFSGILGDRYRFPNQIDLLGQSKDEDSHVAIVHIDGNDMGKLFKHTATLPEIRDLSVTVQNSTDAAFATLLDRIIQKLPDIKNEGIKISTENGRTNLPIRPIIIGGDDVTFVCDGRLGIYFAEIFLKVFMDECEQQKLHSPTPDIEKFVTACAGVAITKSKYPFFRGYGLAEELCKNAKRRRYETNRGGSWLDFHIAYGGFSGSLETIRETHYRATQGSLLMRPYQVRSTQEQSFEQLVASTSQLKYLPQGERNLPNLKIKELRDVLTQGEEAARMFVQEQAARNRKLPQIEAYGGNLFNSEDDPATPYFDMIELMDIYPDFALKPRKEGDA